MSADISKLRLDKAALAGPGGAKPRRRGLILAGLAAALIGAVFFLWPWRVEVKVATVGSLYPYQGLTVLNASGYVVAQRKASVASKVTARLVWLGVEEGSVVKKDDVLARLESQDRQALLSKAKADLTTATHVLEEAKAELTDAGLNFERISALYVKKVLAKSEFDAAEARLRKAKAVYERANSGIQSAVYHLREAEAELEYTMIRAPFDAVVLTKSADVGDIVTPLAATANAKASVVSIADLDSLMVETDVSESNIAKVRPGGPCILTLDAMPGERFPGRVHMIVPTADRTKATVLVKVKFDRRDPRVLPEMSAKAAFLEREMGPGEDVPVTVVPQAAVTERGGRKVVFAVENGKAVEKPVTTQGMIGDLVRVASGLTPGGKVAVSGVSGLSDGQKVGVDDKP